MTKVDSLDTTSDWLQSVFAETIALHQRFVSIGIGSIAGAADMISRSLSGGQKVLAFGNGGSASDAQHLVAELVGRFERERMGLAALALTPDANVVTAIANDYGYDVIFSRQIQALGRAGDVAFGISTSGASRNVLLGLQEARRLGMQTVALTGRDGGTVGAAADVHINVPHLSTARVQEVHRTILHALCGVVEERMCG